MSLQITLFTKDPSNRPHVLVLELGTLTFLKIRISKSEEIKKDIRNSYIIFQGDCNEACKEAKARSSIFRSNSRYFQDYLSIWRNAPQDVRDEYSNVYRNYMNYSFRFVNCNPDEDSLLNRTTQTLAGANNAIRDSSLINCQAESTNMAIGMDNFLNIATNNIHEGYSTGEIQTNANPDVFYSNDSLFENFWINPIILDSIHLSFPLGNNSEILSIPEPTYSDNSQNSNPTTVENGERNSILPSLDDNGDYLQDPTNSYMQNAQG